VIEQYLAVCVVLVRLGPGPANRARDKRPGRRRAARSMVTGSCATPPNGPSRLAPPYSESTRNCARLKCQA